MMHRSMVCVECTYGATPLCGVATTVHNIGFGFCLNMHAARAKGLNIITCYLDMVWISSDYPGCSNNENNKQRCFNIQ